MKIIVVEDDHYAYLTHVYEGHCRNGLPTSELSIATRTFERIKEARTLAPEVALGPAKVVDMGANGIALDVTLPEGEPTPR